MLKLKIGRLGKHYRGGRSSWALTLFLFAYVGTLFMVKVPWGEALRSFVVPSLHWDKDYLTTVVAVLGTAAATLHANTDIQTSAQAAEASRPIAGSFAETIDGRSKMTRRQLGNALGMR